MKRGKKPHRLTHDSFYKADPAWSPDGRFLAYSSDRDGPEAIYIRDMKTGNTRKLTADFTGAEAEAAWSPDGSKIAFQSAVDNESAANTYVADVSSGSFKQVLGTQFEPGRPTWGPDSNTVAMAAVRPYSNRFREGTSEILTVNASTGATTWFNPYNDPFETINNRLEEDGPVWSPDGKNMAYVLDDVLWVQPVNADGSPAGSARQITSEPADQVSWSGDSRHILYDSAGRLRLTTIDGGAPVAVQVPLTWRPRATHGEKVVHAGALWDGKSDDLKHDVDIVVTGNRIVSVGPAKARSAYGKGVHYVDASKLTVLPGLWDAHMHEQMDQPYAGGRRDRIELAFGVTSAMSMGDAAYPALEESESQQSGARPGPRYFWAAEPVDGTRIFYDFMRATDNKQALGRELKRIGALNPDILKTYVRLPNDLEGQAIAAGHKLGIPSFSHYFWPALALGQDGTSHWATQRLGYQIALSNDNIAYDDTIQLYAKSGMSITNTPFFGVQYFQNLLGDQRLKTLLAPWQYAQAEAEYAAGPITPAQESFLRGWSEADAKILAAGGTVLAGTDTPIGIGDFGTVVALGAMSKTGLSNLQVLRAATSAPAKVMGVADQLGTIEAGKLADMIMVRGNPLKDMDAIANDEFVMQNGRVYTQAQLLGPYAAAAANRPPSGRSARAAAKAEARLLSRGHVRLTSPADIRRWQMWAMAACLPPSLTM
jgi:roadblock/LC7 domain-containing protein